MDRWIKDDPAIDQFGLKVDLDVYERHKKLWERLASDLRKSTVKNRIPEACEEFADRLRTTLSAVRDKGELTAIVTFRRLKEGEDKKYEVWMLVQIVKSKPEFTIYPRALYFRLSMVQSGRFMKTIEPHPSTEQDLRLAQKDLLTPRKPNRITSINMPPAPDDGLDFEQREAKHRFAVVDNFPCDVYQLEAIRAVCSDALDSQDKTHFEKLINHQITNRIPNGKAMKFDELHRACGEFASYFRAAHQSDANLVFTIEPFHHGKFSYAQLFIYCSPNEEKSDKD